MNKTARGEGIRPVLILVPVFLLVLTAAAVEHHETSADPDDSHGCIECHDGALGNTVSFCTTNCSALSSHPVFTPYDAGRKRGRFRSRSFAVSRGIRFSDGRVTCISCHDIINSRKGHLVMDNSGSRLCLACHIK